MKGFFVFVLATAIISVTTAATADQKSVMDINLGRNTSHIPPSRIIEGLPAAINDFPYQIYLAMFVLVVETAHCGGSIIAANWVLTAAHCLSLNGVPFTSFQINAGSIVAVDTAPPAQSRTVLFLNAHSHPQYNPVTLMNDIALLNNQEPFDFTLANVKPVSLVAANAFAHPNSYVNQFVTVSGFGYTSNDGPVSPVLLYTKELKGILFSVCQSQISGSTLPTTSFCIQDPTPPPSAICSGDSGGPVTRLIGGVTRQIGVVSYGSSAGCDTAGQGQTNVALFVPWIRTVTGLPL